MTHYKMRYADRKMDEDAARDVLDAGDFCVVSTVDTDGAPYGVPLSYVRVGDALYLHSAIEAGHKLDNFAHDARVFVTVVRNGGAFFQDTFFSTRYESVMAVGHIARVTDGKEVRRALVALCMKYVPQAKRRDRLRNGPRVAVYRRVANRYRRAFGKKRPYESVEQAFLAHVQKRCSFGKLSIGDTYFL